MLSKKMVNFIRLKNQYLRPVFTYLNVNHLNIRNMILIVQENDEFGQAEEDMEDTFNAGLIMTNAKL